MGRPEIPDHIKYVPPGFDSRRVKTSIWRRRDSSVQCLGNNLKLGGEELEISSCISVRDEDMLDSSGYLASASFPKRVN